VKRDDCTMGATVSNERKKGALLTLHDVSCYHVVLRFVMLKCVCAISRKSSKNKRDSKNSAFKYLLFSNMFCISPTDTLNHSITNAHTE
jgi:hypothetical protein